MAAGVRFEEQPPAAFDAACCIHLELTRDSVFTLSTVATARKAPAPAEVVVPVERQGAGCGAVAKWSGGAPFPLPYSTEFGPAQVHFLHANSVVCKHADRQQRQPLTAVGPIQVRFRDFPEFLADVQVSIALLPPATGWATG